MNPRLRRIKYHLLLTFPLVSSDAWAKGPHVCTNTACFIEDAATYAAPRAISYVAPYVSNSLLSSLSWFISPDATPRTIMALGGLGLGAATILHFKKSPTPSAFLANLPRNFFIMAGGATANYLNAQLPTQWSGFTRHSIVTGVVTAAWASVHAQEIRDVRNTLQSREFHKSIVRTLILTVGSAVQGTLYREVADYFVLPKDKAQKKPSRQTSNEWPLKLPNCVVCVSTPHARTPSAKTPVTSKPMSVTPGTNKVPKATYGDDDCDSTYGDDGWESSLAQTRQTKKQTFSGTNTKAPRASRKHTLENPRETGPQKTSDVPSSNTPSWTRAISQNANLAYDATYSWTQTISKHASPAFDGTVVGLWVKLAMYSPQVQALMAPLQNGLDIMAQKIWPWATSLHSDVDDHEHDHTHHDDEHHDEHDNCSDLHSNNTDHSFHGLRTFVTKGWMDGRMCYPLYSGR